jgi:uncharacterized protein (TIGR02266 family)
MSSVQAHTAHPEVSMAINTAPTLPPAPLRARRLRVPYVVEVSFASEHNFWTGFTRDLSEGGVFLATPREVPVGTIVQFELRLPDTTTPWEVRAEVRWTRAQDAAGPDSPPGIGVRFIDLDAALEARIAAFVGQTRDTMFYDE